MERLLLKTELKRTLGIRLSGSNDKSLYKNINAVGHLTIMNFCRLFYIPLTSLRVDYNIRLRNHEPIYQEIKDKNSVIISRLKLDFANLKDTYIQVKKEDCHDYTTWCTLSNAYQNINYFILAHRDYKKLTLKNSSNEDFQNSLIYVMYRDDGIISITGRMNHNYPVINTDFYISVKQLNELVGNIIVQGEKSKTVLPALPAGTIFDTHEDGQFNSIYQAYGWLKIYDIMPRKFRKQYITGKKFWITDGVELLRKRQFAYFEVDEVIISKTVRRINDRCFTKSHIKQLHVPDTVIKIHPMAFWLMSELKQLRLPPLKKISLKKMGGMKTIFHVSDKTIIENNKTQKSRIVTYNCSIQ
jgi:hypothetical protein